MEQRRKTQQPLYRQLHTQKQKVAHLYNKDQQTKKTIQNLKARLAIPPGQQGNITKQSSGISLVGHNNPNRSKHAQVSHQHSSIFDMSASEPNYELPQRESSRINTSFISSHHCSNCDRITDYYENIIENYRQKIQQIQQQKYQRQQYLVKMIKKSEKQKMIHDMLNEVKSKTGNSQKANKIYNPQKSQKQFAIDGQYAPDSYRTGKKQFENKQGSKLGDSQKHKLNRSSSYLEKYYYPDEDEQFHESQIRQMRLLEEKAQRLKKREKLERQILKKIKDKQMRSIQGQQYIQSQSLKNSDEFQQISQRYATQSINRVAKGKMSRTAYQGKAQFHQKSSSGFSGLVEIPEIQYTKLKQENQKLREALQQSSKQIRVISEQLDSQKLYINRMYNQEREGQQYSKTNKMGESGQIVRQKRQNENIGDIAKLKRQNQQLSQSNKLLQKTKKTNKTMEAKNDELWQQLSQKINSLQKLKAQNQKFHLQNIYLKRNLEQMRVACEDQISALKDQIQSIRETNGSKDKIINSLKAQQKRLKEIQDQSSKRQLQARAQLQKMNNVFTQQMIDKQQFQRKEQALNKQLYAKDKDLKRAKNQLISLETQNRSMQDIISQTRQQKDYIAKDLQRVNIQLKSVAIQYSNLEKETHNSYQLIQTLNKQVQMKEQLAKAQGAEIGKLRSSIQSKDGQLSKKRDLIELLGEANKNLSIQTEKHIEKALVLETSLKQATSKLQQTFQKLREANLGNEKANQKSEQISQKCELLQRQIEQILAQKVKQTEEKNVLMTIQISSRQKLVSELKQENEFIKQQLINKVKHQENINAELVALVQQYKKKQEQSGYQLSRKINQLQLAAQSAITKEIQLSQARNQLKSIYDQISQLRLQLENERNSNKKEIQEICNQRDQKIVNLQKQVISIKTQLVTKISQIQGLQQHIQTVKCKQTQLNEKLQQSLVEVSQLAIIRNNQAETQQKFKNLRQELAQKLILKQQIINAKNVQLQTIRGIMEQNECQRQQNQSELILKNLQIKQLQQRMKQMEKKCQQIIVKLKTIEERYVELNNQIIRSEAQNQRIKNEMKDLKRKNKQLSDEIVANNNQLSEKNAQIQSLNQTSLTLQIQLDSFSAKIKALQQQLRISQNQVNQQHGQIELKQQRINQIEKIFEQQGHEKSRVLLEKTNQVQSLKQLLAKNEQKAEQAQQALKQSELQKAQAMQAKQSTEMHLKMAIQKSSQQIEQLKKKYQNQSAQMMKNQLIAQKELTQARLKTQQLVSTISSISQDLTTAKRQIESRQNEISQLNLIIKLKESEFVQQINKFKKEAQQQLAIKQAQIRQTQSKGNEVRIQLNRIQQELQQTMSQNELIKSKLENTQMKLQNQKSQKQQIVTNSLMQAQQNQKQIAAFQQLLNAELSKVDTLQSKLKHAQEQASAAQTLSKRQQEQMQQITLKLTSQTNTINELQTQTNALIQQIKGKDQMLQKTNEQKMALKRQIEILQSDVTSEKQELITLTTENQTIKRDLQQSKKTLQREVQRALKEKLQSEKKLELQIEKQLKLQEDMIKKNQQIQVITKFVQKVQTQKALLNADKCQIELHLESQENILIENKNAIDGLRSQKHQLQQQLKSQQNEMQTFKAQLQLIKRERDESLQRKSKQLESKEQSIRDKEKYITQLVQQIKNKEDSFKLQEIQCSKQEEQCSKLRQEISEKQIELQNRQKQNQILSNQINQRQKEIQDLLKQNGDLNKLINEKQTEIESIVNQNQLLTRQVNQIKAQLQNRFKENQRLAKQINQKQTEVQNTLKENQQLKKQINLTQNETQNILKDNQKLNKNIQERQSTIQTMLQSNQLLSKQVSQKQNRVQTMVKQNQQLMKLHKNSLKQVQELKVLVQQALQEKQQIHNNLTQAQLKFEETNGKFVQELNNTEQILKLNSQLQSQITEIKDRANLIEQEKMLQKRQFENYRAQMQVFKKQMETVKKQMQDYRRQMQALKKQSEAKMCQMIQNKVKLEKQLGISEETNDQLNIDIERLIQGKRATEAQLEFQVKQNQKIRIAINQLEELKSTRDLELSKLKLQLKKKEEAMHELQEKNYESESSYKSQLKQIKLKNQQIFNNLQQFKKGFEKNEREKRTLNSQISKLKNERNALQGRINQMEQQNQDKLDNDQKLIEELKAEIAQKDRNIKEFAQNLKLIKDYHVQLQKTVNQRNSQLAKKGQQIQAKNQQMIQINKEFESLKQNHQRLSDQFQQNIKQKNNLSQQNRSIKVQNQRLKYETKYKDGLLAQLQDTQNKMIEQANTLKHNHANEMQSLKNQIQNYTTLLQQQVSVRKVEESKVRNLEEILKQKSNQLESLKQSLQQSNSQNLENLKQNEDLKQQIKNYKLKIIQFENQVQGYIKENNNLRQFYDEKMELIKSLDQSHENSQKILLEREAQLVSKKSQMNLINQKLKRYENERTSILTDIEKRNQQFKKTSQKLKQKEKQLQKITIQFAKSKKELEEKSRSLSEKQQSLAQSQKKSKLMKQQAQLRFKQFQQRIKIIQSQKLEAIVQNQNTVKNLLNQLKQTNVSKEYELRKLRVQNQKSTTLVKELERQMDFYKNQEQMWKQRNKKLQQQKSKDAAVFEENMLKLNNKLSELNSEKAKVEQQLAKHRRQSLAIIQSRTQKILNLEQKLSQVLKLETHDAALQNENDTLKRKLQILQQKIISDSQLRQKQLSHSSISRDLQNLSEMKNASKITQKSNSKQIFAEQVKKIIEKFCKGKQNTKFFDFYSKLFKYCSELSEYPIHGRFYGLTQEFLNQINTIFQQADYWLRQRQEKFQKYLQKTGQILKQQNLMTVCQNQFDASRSLQIPISPKLASQISPIVDFKFDSPRYPIQDLQKKSLVQSRQEEYQNQIKDLGSDKSSSIKKINVMLRQDLSEAASQQHQSNIEKDDKNMDNVLQSLHQQIQRSQGQTGSFIANDTRSHLSGMSGRTFNRTKSGLGNLTKSMLSQKERSQEYRKMMRNTKLKNKLKAKTKKEQ